MTQNTPGNANAQAGQRRLVVTEYVSLDGVMEDPGGAEKFEHGGWTVPYWNDEIGQT